MPSADIDRLLQSLTDKDAYARRLAAERLAQLPAVDDRALAALKATATSDSNAVVRSAAAKGYHNLTGETAAPPQPALGAGGGLLDWRGWRIFMFAGTMLLAGLIAAGSIEGLLFGFAFPLGLFAVPIGLLGSVARALPMPPGAAEWASGGSGLGLLALLTLPAGWALYAALAVAAVRAAPVRRFALLYVFFVVLLVINVAGCRAMLSGIH
jgi:hypothetical protein